MTARKKQFSGDEKGAEILFSRLTKVGNLTSRDIDLLTFPARELTNKTNPAADLYQAHKGCLDNFTTGDKECQHLVSLAGNIPLSDSQVYSGNIFR